MTTCAAVWCDRDAVARGLCKRCYDRYRRGISPISPTKRHAVAEDKARLRNEITLRREAGQSIADIAAAVGVNTSTASRWLREWEVEVGRREDSRATNLWQPWTRDDIDFAATRTDLTISERAAALGRSVSSVEECLRKYGRSPLAPTTQRHQRGTSH
ncbi:helix-turn-helix domain-containing protein [Brevibacterium pigmentatum]|uniref:helix-turn-helix domain-containing protein n=1 Tax=Brevibacterium pigmentatum TaxID=1496080 RepID=UPI00141E3540